MCDLQMRKDTRINSQTHPIKHLNNRGLDSNKNKHASCRYIQLSSLIGKNNRTRGTRGLYKITRIKTNGASELNKKDPQKSTRKKKSHLVLGVCTESGVNPL